MKQKFQVLLPSAQNSQQGKSDIICVWLDQLVISYFSVVVVNAAGVATPGRVQASVSDVSLFCIS